jgi:hypothetical protein
MQLWSCYNQYREGSIYVSGKPSSGVCTVFCLWHIWDCIMLACAATIATATAAASLTAPVVAACSSCTLTPGAATGAHCSTADSTIEAGAACGARGIHAVPPLEPSEDLGGCWHRKSERPDPDFLLPADVSPHHASAATSNQPCFWTSFPGLLHIICRSSDFIRCTQEAFHRLHGARRGANPSLPWADI